MDNSNLSPTELDVVIAAFNAERTIGNAIRSAFSSGARQVIVVDDGSSDSTGKTALAAGALVLEQSNQGASAARARGLQSVEADFVIFLDADDELVPEGTKQSVELLRNTPNASVAAGRVIGFSRFNTGQLLPSAYVEVTVTNLLQTGFGAWPPGAAVVRVRSARDAARQAPTALAPRFAEDYELLIRLARVGEVIKHESPSLRYEMSGGKSVRSARDALECKEAIRGHYSTAWGIPVRLMSSWRLRAAANKRQARALTFRGKSTAAAVRMALAYGQGALSLLQGPRRAEPSNAEYVQVYEWATGQDDNIGDSLLRRPSLHDARLRGRVLHVFTGSSSEAFDTGLDLSEADVRYRSFRKWLFSALRASLSRRVIIIPNAGEVMVSRRGAARLAGVWLASVMPNATLLWAGAGVPGRRTIWSVPYRLVAAQARHLSFRDAESVALLGRGQVAPDWAFSLGTAPEHWPGRHARHRVSFVLRGDRRPPTEEWIAWAAQLASELRLIPTFVVQVRRDNVLAAQLAERTGGEVISFASEQDHASQELAVRHIYRESLIAVGDRLHGLIVAATEGAVPLGWVPSSTGKIGRHFLAVDMAYVGEYEGMQPTDLPNVGTKDIDLWRSSLAVKVEDARARIRTVRAEMTDAMKLQAKP